MTMSPDELESAALASLTTADDIRRAAAAGVTDLSFQNPDYEKVWQYLVEKSAKGQSVTHADILRVCGVELPPGLTDSDTLISALVSKSTERRVYAAVSQRFTEIGADPVGTARQLVADLAAIAAPATQAHTRYFDADVDARMAEYERRSEQVSEMGYTGWQTGLPVFDDAGDTFKPGEMVAIQGATNTGKSFLLLWLCKNVYWRHDASVLFISPENTVSDIEARLDPMIAFELGIPLSVRGLRNGTQDRAALREYAEKLKAHKRRGWVTLDAGTSGTFSVSDVVSLAREHRPQVLAIDGFHLIRGERGMKSWESIKYAADTIKGVAQELGCVVLAVSQAQRDAVLASDTTPEVGQAAYGIALNEASNRVISMTVKTGQADQRIFTVPKMRDAERVTHRHYLHFGVDAGDIHEIVPKVNTESGEVDF